MNAHNQERMSGAVDQEMFETSEQGRLNKVQRGELFCSVPFGCVLMSPGKVAFDPDEQARSIVHLRL